MHDDSRDNLVEYSNAAASKLFGRSYLDLFGSPSHTLIADQPAAQEDWAFAVRDADESFRKYTVVPRLEFKAADDATAVAQDVLIWRVDSLEDTSIGQAMLIRRWQLSTDAQVQQ